MPNDVEAEHDTDWGPALSEQFAKADSEGGANDSGRGVPGVEPQAPGQHGADTANAGGEPADTATTAQDDRERDDSGRFVAKKPGAASSGTPPARTTGSGAQAGAASGAPNGAAAPQSAAPVVPPAPVLPVLKAPQNWTPAVREEWAKLPPAVQREIIRADKAYQAQLHEAADATKASQGWGETVRPYEAQFRQAGVQPQQYVGDLLRTAHALTYSAPQQKAEILAGLVGQFGVTPQDLDAALVARMQGQPAQPQQPQRPPIDEESILRKVEERIQATANQRVAEAELVKVAPELEYIEDLKDDMAKVFEAGLASDYKEAYALALQLPKNADTLALVRSKEAAKSAANAQASTQRARAAASSVSSKPGGPGGSTPPGDDDDWDAHLNASWDRLASR